jgi:hypothetical protein
MNFVYKDLPLERIQPEIDRISKLKFSKCVNCMKQKTKYIAYLKQLKRDKKRLDINKPKTR